MNGEGKGDGVGFCVAGCNLGTESKTYGGNGLELFLVAGRGASFVLVLPTVCGSVIVSSESEDSLVSFLTGRPARLWLVVEFLVGRLARLWVMADVLE